MDFMLIPEEEKQNEVGKTPSKRTHSENFRKWLPSSYEQIQGQLHWRKEQRLENSLEWALNMPEFQNWRQSTLDESSDNRILWINGPLGMGKSIMSGYYVELLKQHYPNAIVAYFFCRSNEKGLTEACDIVRTLAYQYAEDVGVKAVLDGLKNTGFRTDGTLPLSYLFEKFLREPLLKAENWSFIVLDGVDEADWERKEQAGYSAEPEMQVLLKCLAKLPSTRLLLVSRPGPDISKFVPNIKQKLIGKAENREDIKAYVTEFIAKKLPQLQSYFIGRREDPIHYFHENANGLFLWVVLVLQQLENANFRSQFDALLNASPKMAGVGTMDGLYAAVLNKISHNARECVREIIRWVIVAESPLSVTILKAVVECSISEPPIDFEKVLKEECGSILHLVGDDDTGVQVVHETFRSFVTDRDRGCPKEFFIDEEASHGQVTLLCLNDLTAADTPKFTNLYGLQQWSSHLSKATAAEEACQLLVALRQFFTSDALKSWIKQVLLPKLHHGWNDLEVSIEVEYMDRIAEWVQKCPTTKEEGEVSETHEQVGTLTTDTKKGVLAQLRECLGKGAASLLLSEVLGCFEARACFRVALNYYIRREKSNDNNLSSIIDLTDAEFDGFSEWIGKAGQPMNHQNLGMAFFELQRWENCIRYLDHDSAANTDSDVQCYLGLACMALSDYDGTIQAFRRLRLRESGMKSMWLRPGLLDAYEAKVDYAAAIREFEEAMPVQVDDRGISPRFDFLGYIYSAKGEYDTAIKIFDENWSGHWSLLGLYEAYMRKNDLEEGINKIKEKASSDSWGIKCLGDMYNQKGDYDGSIETFQSAVIAKNNHRFMTPSLVRAYAAKGDHDRAIREFETLFTDHIDLGARYPWTVAAVLESYKMTETYDRVIRTFKGELDKRVSYSWRWSLWGLLEAYNGKGEYEKVIETFHSLIDNDPNSPEQLDLLTYAALVAYIAKADYDGAITIAEKAIEGNANFYMPLLLYCVHELYKTKRDHDQGIHIFDAVVKNHPLRPGPWHLLAESYRAKGDYDAAYDTYQLALQQISVDYLFHKHLGDIYLLKLRYSDAVKAYKFAINKARSESMLWAYLQTQPYQLQDLYPSNPVIRIDHNFGRNFIWHSLAEAYRANSESDSATVVYDAVINGYHAAIKGSSRNDLLWQHHEPQIETGLFDVFYDKSHLPYPVLWAALGEVYRCKGEPPNALKAFHRALQMEPDNCWLQNVVHELVMLTPLSPVEESRLEPWRPAGESGSDQENVKDGVGTDCSIMFLRNGVTGLPMTVCHRQVPSANFVEDVQYIRL